MPPALARPIRIQAFLTACSAMLLLQLEANTGVPLVAGVDEAGRGPLAGPVVAAAVVVDRNAHTPLHDVNDSKTIPQQTRDKLYHTLVTDPTVGVGVAVVDRKTIDDINILQATMLAMRLAVESIPKAFAPQRVLVDGPRCPEGLQVPADPLVKGDARCYSIAAASIVAKVTRDRIMLDLHNSYPQYGFDQHMGYGTRAHVSALHRYGPTSEHRVTFNPLKTWLLESKGTWSLESKGLGEHAKLEPNKSSMSNMVRTSNARKAQICSIDKVSNKGAKSNEAASCAAPGSTQGNVASVKKGRRTKPRLVRQSSASLKTVRRSLRVAARR